jgi:hypothetical protein
MQHAAMACRLGLSHVSAALTKIAHLHSDLPTSSIAAAVIARGLYQRGLSAAILAAPALKGAP